MNITRNFTLEELTASATATRLGIDNTPSEAVKRNLTRLATDIMQRIRDRWGQPIIVSSGYRSQALNRAVGGSPTSQHCLGQACDFHAVNRDNNWMLYALIREMVRRGDIICGQIIWEYGTRQNPQWIHISLPGGHTNQFIKIGVN